MPVAVLSALPLSIAKPLTRLWRRGRYDAYFRKYGTGSHKDRVYIPYNSVKPIAIEAPTWLTNFLEEQGWDVVNYVLGLAQDKKGRVKKIGKLLTEGGLSPNDSLFKDFVNDEDRAVANKAAWVVISRHPYDIAGMSFDRGWTSCMNYADETDDDRGMEGSAFSTMKADIRAGTLVAYLIKGDDKNINRPIARIAIRPCRNVLNPSLLLLLPGPMYGTANMTFHKIVQNFAAQMNAHLPDGMYKLVPGLYSDVGYESEGFYRFDGEDYLSRDDLAKFVSLLVKNSAAQRMILDLARSSKLKKSQSFNFQGYGFFSSTAYEFSVELALLRGSAGAADILKDKNATPEALNLYLSKVGDTLPKLLGRAYKGREAEFSPQAKQALAASSSSAIRALLVVYDWESMSKADWSHVDTDSLSPATMTEMLKKINLRTGLSLKDLPGALVKRMEEMIPEQIADCATFWLTNTPTAIQRANRLIDRLKDNPATLLELAKEALSLGLMEVRWKKILDYGNNTFRRAVLHSELYRSKFSALSLEVCEYALEKWPDLIVSIVKEASGDPPDSLILEKILTRLNSWTQLPRVRNVLALSVRHLDVESRVLVPSIYQLLVRTDDKKNLAVMRQGYLDAWKDRYGDFPPTALFIRYPELATFDDYVKFIPDAASYPQGESRTLFELFTKKYKKDPRYREAKDKLRLIVGFW